MTKKNLIISYMIIALLIILDQLSKQLILANLKYAGETIEVIPNFFDITLVYNKGAAWGMGADSTIILTIISLVAGSAAIYFATKNDFTNRKMYSISLCLIVAGAFGNLVDRALTVFGQLDGVIDFFSFTFGTYRYPVFNIADMCLVIGVIMLVVDILIIQEIKKKKAK